MKNRIRLSLLFALLALMDLLVTAPQPDGPAKTTVIRARRRPNPQRNGRQRRKSSA